jgi:hypothetical protein
MEVGDACASLNTDHTRICTHGITFLKFCEYFTFFHCENFCNMFITIKSFAYSEVMKLIF